MKFFQASILLATAFYNASTMAFTPSGTASISQSSSVASLISNKSRMNRQNNIFQIQADQVEEKVYYGEESRKYRRDVFGHEDWLRHRRSDRFLYNLSTIPLSGLWRQIREELLAVSVISTVIVVWNALFCYGYYDFDGVFYNPVTYGGLPVLQLPIMPFTLLTPVLSLLLVFRTNASYGRWAEARKQWGVMGTECRNVMRMAAAWSSPMRQPDVAKREQAVSEVGNTCYIFLRSLLRHVSGHPDEEAFRKDLFDNLPEKEAQSIIDAGHRPFRALYWMSRKIEALPMSERQRIEVDKSCVIIGDVCGGTERVYGTPVPTSYSRLTSRFLTTWLFFLPFALYEPFQFTWNHIAIIPVSVVISGFFFVIEELSIQLEEPFSILALPGMVQAMKNFSEQLPKWHAMYTNEEYNPKVYGGEESPQPRVAKIVDSQPRVAKLGNGDSIKQSYQQMPYSPPVTDASSFVPNGAPPQPSAPEPETASSMNTGSFEDFIYGSAKRKTSDSSINQSTPAQITSTPPSAPEPVVQQDPYGAIKSSSTTPVEEMRNMLSEVRSLNEQVRTQGYELGHMRERIDALNQWVDELMKKSTSTGNSANGLDPYEVQMQLYTVKSKLTEISKTMK